jgi:4,5-dihydroxyphthalate decarboxylase
MTGKTYPESGPVSLDVNMNNSPLSKALFDGEVKSDLVTLNFVGPKAAHEAFKPMVQERKFDVSEMAIVTYLQALTYGKPLVLLPTVVLARPQHHCILVHVDKGIEGPKDIEGRRIASRSYAQATAVWVRGILQHDYDVDINKVDWAVSGGGHLAEYTDPSIVSRLPAGSKPDEMLVAGEVDGAILGADMPDEPRVKHLIPNAKAAGQEWVKKHGFTPINHLMSVDKDLHDQRPDVVEELYRMLEASRALGAADDAARQFGVEKNRKGLEAAIQYSFDQQVIPKKFEVDELFSDLTRTFGA